MMPTSSNTTSFVRLPKYGALSTPQPILFIFNRNAPDRL
jgi:hypothetical protein